MADKLAKEGLLKRDDQYPTFQNTKKISTKVYHRGIQIQQNIVKFSNSLISQVHFSGWMESKSAPPVINSHTKYNQIQYCDTHNISFQIKCRFKQLATRVLLNSRYNTIEKMCPRCGLEDEDLHHMFWCTSVNHSDKYIKLLTKIHNYFKKLKKESPELDVHQDKISSINFDWPFAPIKQIGEKFHWDDKMQTPKQHENRNMGDQLVLPKEIMKVIEEYGIHETKLKNRA
jgi:hypothetical protein